MSLFSHFQGKVWPTSLPHCTVLSHCSLKYRFKQCHNARISFLVSKSVSAFLIIFKFRQNASFKYIVFNFFPVSNRFKYRQSACFIDFVFIYLAAVPNRLNTVRMHALETLFKRISLQLILLWRVCITEKRNIFSAWQTLQNMKLFPSKHALKCSKMQLRRYKISIFSEGTCPPDTQNNGTYTLINPQLRP